MTSSDADMWCKENGYNFRVAEIDGAALFLTQELDPSRINVSTNNGLVQDIKGLF